MGRTNWGFHRFTPCCENQLETFAGSYLALPDSPGWPPLLCFLQYICKGREVVPRHAQYIQGSSTCTPASGETFSTLALSSFGVAFAPVVANALLCTVWSEPALRTSLRAN